MAIGFTRNGGQFLPDGEELLNRWIELGSLQKVAEHYKRAGLVNPESHKEISRQAIHQKIFTWAFKSDANLAKLRRVWKNNITSAGLPEPTEEEWRDYAVSKLINRGYPTTVIKFLNSHPEYKPHAEKFARTTA